MIIRPDLPFLAPRDSNLYAADSGMDRAGRNARMPLPPSAGRVPQSPHRVAHTHRRRWFPLTEHANQRLQTENITRLLVVDDNVDMRFAMYECLSAEGYDVSVAGDGLRGLALARMTAPHAILLDIGMPELDGFSTARAMRGIVALRDVPMIAVTGFYDKPHFDNARASGFDFYFQKPVEIDALLELLRGAAPESPES